MRLRKKRFLAMGLAVLMMPQIVPINVLATEGETQRGVKEVNDVDGLQQLDEEVSSLFEEPDNDMLPKKIDEEVINKLESLIYSKNLKQSLEGLTETYNEYIESDYYGEVLLKNNDLLDAKVKLTTFINQMLQTNKVDDEIKSELAEILELMYKSQYLAANNGLKNIKYINESTNDTKSKKLLSKCIEQAKNEFEKATEFNEKGSLIPLMKALNLCSMHTIKGYKYSESLFDGQYLKEGIDTDNDGLEDMYEFLIGSNPFVKDTDGDGLTDYQEVEITLTSPIKFDTDDNGIGDSDEDFDSDGLENIEEITLEGNPYSNDTDRDELLDNEERNFGTKLNVVDTDEDRLSDSKEIELGTDPLNPDTDGDGILDGDEVFTITKTISDEDADLNVKPSIVMDVPGHLIETLSIEKVSGNDFYLPDIMPGYIGAGYEFELDGMFDSASLTFTFNKDLIQNPGFEPAIYYCDEENQEMILLENQTVDLVNGTVAVELEHFSKYILLNKIAFEKVWDTEIKPPNSKNDPAKSLVIAMSIDSSGSMSWNDRYDLRKDAAKSFVDQLGENDKAAVIDFDSYAKLLSELTSDKSTLYNAIDRIDSSGGTNIGAGVDLALRQIENQDDATKYIIVLTDGQGSYYSSYTQRAIAMGVTIYTIGLGSGVNRSLLESIATQTGGKYFHASTAEDLKDVFDEAASETIDVEKDTDGDGITDYYEKLGSEGKLLAFNGTDILKTDYTKADTDGEGLSDGEEYIVKNNSRDMTYGYVFTKPCDVDSDLDGYNDLEDLMPLVKFKTPVILIHGRSDNTASCFGAEARIKEDHNNHYNSDITLTSKLNYTDASSHKILDLKRGMLGKELEKYLGNRTKNKSLFAFNYPNKDMVKFNSAKFKMYIEDLTNKAKAGTHLEVVENGYIFPTKQAMENGEYKFDLVGHSMGGLISRYYVENLGGNKHVRKLITIDTPHFGSGLATLGYIVAGLDLTFPCDQDLSQKSWLVTGKKDKAIPQLYAEKKKYMLLNQTPEFKYESAPVSYYAIGGYDVKGDGEGWVKGEMKGIPEEYRNKTFIFDFIKAIGTKEAFNNSIRTGLKTISGDIKLELKDSSGDNVVNIMSQFGVKDEWGYITKSVFFKKTSLNVDTNPGHSARNNHFHGLNQKDQNVIKKVVEYLKD